jgi:hypothetical protein
MTESAAPLPGDNAVLPAARFCRTPMSAHIPRTLRRIPPTAVRLPCACFEPLPHCHNGRWRARWLAKTGYDFGYCEWLFAEEGACRHFAAFVPKIGFGENCG